MSRGHAGRGPAGSLLRILGREGVPGDGPDGGRADELRGGPFGRGGAASSSGPSGGPRRADLDARQLACPPAGGGRFPHRLARALDAGPVAAFQFRVKGVDQHQAARLAEPLQRLCAEREVAFIVNDSISLAKRLGADGVHLGQEDGDPREARAALGPAAQIGVTCHDSRHLAMEAGEAGADYVAFGSFHPPAPKEVRHLPEPVILPWLSAWFVLPPSLNHL